MRYTLRCAPMLLESPALPAEDRSYAPATPRAPAATEWRDVTALLAAANELGAYEDTAAMLRRAVELVRERLGLERVSFYLRDPSLERIVMRGTCGTDARGESCDEWDRHYECAPSDHDALLAIQQHGALWMHHDQAPLISEEPGVSRVIARGWLVVTPLVSARELVGVMYNDSALTMSPVDEGKQARAALFCSLLAGHLLSRRGQVPWQPLQRQGKRGQLIEKALAILQQSPMQSGGALARLLGVSPGHLAREFKAEMGLSLVEHRNRLRLARFFSGVEQNRKSLLEAALEAGFGSYAHFHRVYRKLQGATPRDDLLRRAASAEVERR